MNTFEISDFFRPLLRLTKGWEPDGQLALDLLLREIQEKLDHLAGAEAKNFLDKSKTRIGHSARLFENIFLRDDNLQTWKGFLKVEEGRKRANTQKLAATFLKWCEAPQESPAEEAIRFARSVIANSKSWKRLTIRQEEMDKLDSELEEAADREDIVFESFEDRLLKAALRELIARIIWRLRNE